MSISSRKSLCPLHAPTMSPRTREGRAAGQAPDRSLSPPGSAATALRSAASAQPGTGMPPGAAISYWPRPPWCCGSRQPSFTPLQRKQIVFGALAAILTRAPTEHKRPQRRPEAIITPSPGPGACREVQVNGGR